MTSIDADDWPALRAAIDQAFDEIATYETD
jgi:hypothetical protein